MQLIPIVQLQHITGGATSVTLPASLALTGWTPKNIPEITPPRPRPPLA